MTSRVPQVETERWSNSRRGLALLWFSVLAGPVAFLLAMQAAYIGVPQACESKATLGLHVIMAIGVTIIVAGAAAGAAAWRRAGATWPDDDPTSAGRARFMASAGLFLSGFFGLLVLAQWIPVFMLDPCQ